MTPKNKKPIRIMVVDDHSVVRMGLNLSVNVEPDMVLETEASSGEEAIELYRQRRPDVVLMDLKLPGISGVEATRAICKEFPDAVIVMFATNDTEEDIFLSLKAGACTYVLKTATRAELIDTIRAAHSGQRRISPEVGIRLAERTNHPNLSAREISVLELIARGKSNKEIAIALDLAEATAKLHVSHILNKLGVDDRTHATTIALQRGIVRLD
jgi:two-component system NarL family response regulator